MAEARILRLPSRVVFDTVPGVLEQAAVALQPGGGDAAVDLSGCTEFDSSLIALLLELRRRMAGASAGRLRVTDPPPNLRKLAALYGVDELLFERD
jgi:phospholipid transport system transporter-binding protein